MTDGTSINYYSTSSISPGKTSLFSKLPSGVTYHVYTFVIAEGSAVIDDAQGLPTIEVYANCNSIDLDIRPECNLTVISGNGLYYMGGYENHLKMNQDGLSIKFGGSHFTIDEYGIRYFSTKDSMWKKLE
jgi:hypothetical protein